MSERLPGSSMSAHLLPGQAPCYTDGRTYERWVDMKDWTQDPFAGLPDASAPFAGTELETSFERHQREGVKALLSMSRPVLYDDGEPETTSEHASHSSYDENCRACAAEAEPPEYQPDEDPGDEEAWIYA